MPGTYEWLIKMAIVHSRFNKIRFSVGFVDFVVQVPSVLSAEQILLLCPLFITMTRYIVLKPQP